MNRSLLGVLLALALVPQVQAAVKHDTKANKASAKATRLSAVKASVPIAARKSPIPVLPDLSPAQLAIADKVYQGKIQCELGVHVTMKPDQRGTGYFQLETPQKRYLMLPVVSTTGAVRLEDPASGAVWVQLANKSMLMNQKLGQRLADECMHPEQVQVAQLLRQNPVPGLFDSVPSPAEAVPAAVAATE